MRFDAPFLRATINNTAPEGATENYEVTVGVFSSEVPSPETLIHWEAQRDIPSRRMARLVIMSIVKDFGHTTVLWKEVCEPTSTVGKCYATKSQYTEWLERKRAEAAYDAANGYDLDDEGFSLHDYS